MFSTSAQVLFNRSFALAALACCTFAPAAGCAAQENDEIRVSVTRVGDVVQVRANFAVPTGAAQAFAVLTDYDHMREFLPGVVESKVIQRAPERLVVSQSVRMKVGFLSVPVDTVRQVELTPPTKLVSHALSGPVSKGEVTTTLVETQGTTRVTYESEATLSSWMPAGLGTKLIGTHVREQLTSMRAEILRRSAVAR